MDNNEVLLVVFKMPEFKLKEHWPLSWLFKKQAFIDEYINVYNKFAEVSEECYKEWNKEFADSKLGDPFYETFMATKLQKWLDEHINNGHRALTWKADPVNAQIYGVNEKHPDVTIRIHLEKR